MNEYTINFLNGLVVHLTATDWKDAIIEAKLHAERKGYANGEIKRIIDEDGKVIKNINLKTLEWTWGEDVNSGIQA